MKKLMMLALPLALQGASAQGRLTLADVSRGVASREAKSPAILAEVTATEVWWRSKPVTKKFKFGVSGAKTRREEVQVEPRTVDGQRFPGEQTIQIADGVTQQCVYLPVEGEREKFMRADIGKNAATNINNPNPAQGALKVGQWWISEVLAKGSDLRIDEKPGALVRVTGKDLAGRPFVLDLAKDRGFVGVHAIFSEFGYTVESTVRKLERFEGQWLPTNVSVKISAKQKEGPRTDITSDMKVRYIASSAKTQSLFEFKKMPAGSPVRNLDTGQRFRVAADGSLQLAAVHNRGALVFVGASIVLLACGLIFSTRK